ncbi:MAG: hypothetical protein CL669_04420 [Balneola sp.]|nr:hypothetical protein [Balneola sp.]
MTNYTVTPYGLCFGVGIFISSILIGHYTWQLLGLVVLSVVLQSFLCDTCSYQYTYASILSALPILLLLLSSDPFGKSSCSYLKTILIAISVGAAIGRIGCYVVGCCSGGECPTDYPLGLKYTDSFINRKFNVPSITVYPSVLLEIILQSVIAFVVWKSDYGIQLYGILNMLLLALTNTWRMEKRMGGNEIISYGSLLLFSVLSYWKCGPTASKLKPQFKWIYLFASAVVTFITSNDINFSSKK